MHRRSGRSEAGSRSAPGRHRRATARRRRASCAPGGSSRRSPRTTTTPAAAPAGVATATRRVRPRVRCGLELTCGAAATRDIWPPAVDDAPKRRKARHVAQGCVLVSARGGLRPGHVASAPVPGVPFHPAGMMRLLRGRPYGWPMTGPAWQPERPRIHLFKLIVSWLAMGVALMVAAGLLPGVRIDDFWGALVVAAVVAALNALIPPRPRGAAPAVHARRSASCSSCSRTPRSCSSRPT